MKDEGSTVSLVGIFKVETWVFKIPSILLLPIFYNSRFSSPEFFYPRIFYSQSSIPIPHEDPEKIHHDPVCAMYNRYRYIHIDQHEPKLGHYFSSPHRSITTNRYPFCTTWPSHGPPSARSLSLISRIKTKQKKGRGKRERAGVGRKKVH